MATVYYRVTGIILYVCLFLITFAIILPHLCKDKIYSSYFRSENPNTDLVGRAYRANMQRFRQASIYLKRLQNRSDIGGRLTGGYSYPAGQSHRSRARGPSIAVGVISLQRSAEKGTNIRLGYLTQVIASLLRGLNDTDLFTQIQVFICNVDSKATDHQEATALSSVVDTYVKYVSEDYLQNLREPWQVFEKEKQDYQYCLEKSLRSLPDYVVILEDDAVPKDDFFKLLYKILNKRKHRGLNNSTQQSDCSKLPVDWAFLKLYYPQKWAGYAYELRHMTELFFFGAVGGIVFSAGYLAYWRLVTSHRWQASCHILVFLLGAVYVVSLLHVTGRPYVIEYMHEKYGWYWVTNDRRCCTQSVVYPAEVVPHLIHYISGKECDIDYSIDHVLNDFADDCRLRSYLVEPNLVNHIGMLSSLRGYAKRPAEFI